MTVLEVGSVKGRPRILASDDREWLVWLERNPALAFLLLTFLTNMDRFLLGPYGVIRFHDTFDSWVVSLKTVGTSFLAHGVQGWSPYVVGGFPSYAAAISPLFIGNFMAGVMPLWLVYAIFKTLAVFVAGYGMYRYLKLSLSDNPLACLFGGFLFASIGHLEQNSHVLAWGFPLFFVWASALVSAEARLHRLLYGLGLTAFAFNAPLHVTVPIYPVLHLMFVYLHFKEKGFRAHLVGWGLIWGGYLLVNAPMFYGILSFAPESHRVTWRPETHALPSLIPAIYGVFRDSYFSLPFFLLSPFAWKCSDQRYIKGLIIVTAAVLLVLILLQSHYRSSFVHLLHFKYSGAANIVQKIHVLPFLMTVLISIGFGGLVKDSRQLATNLFWIVPVTVVAAAFPYMMKPGFSQLQRLPVAITCGAMILLFLMGGLILQILARYGLVRTSLVCVGLLLAIPTSSRAFSTVTYELRTFNEVFAEDSPLAALPREGTQPYRTVYIGQELNVAAEYRGLETVDGYANLYPMTFKEFWSRVISRQLELSERTRTYFGERGNRVYLYTLYDRILPLPHDVADIRASLSLLALANVRYVISPVPLADARGKMVGIRRPREKEFPSGGFLAAVGAFQAGQLRQALAVLYARLRARLRSTQPLYVYQFEEGFARAFLVPEWRVLDSDAAVLDRLSQANVEELRTKAFLSRERGDPLPPPSDFPESTALQENSVAQIMRYTPDQIQIETSSSRPALLVVTNNFHHKWQATVNGSFQPVYRVNHTFQAVWVPAGKSRVTLEYCDGTLWMLHGLVPMGLLMILGPTLLPVKEGEGCCRQEPNR